MITPSFDELYNDIDQTKEFGLNRPLLAHYTSMANLESILRANEIWLSNPLFMSDYEELRFGMNEALALVLGSKELAATFADVELHKRALRAYESQFSHYANNFALDVYVLCLSEHTAGDLDGRLSMWRGYGSSGNGVCMVIDTSKTEPVDGTPFILAPVRYGSSEERRLAIVGYIKRFCECLRAVDHNKHSPEQTIVYLFNRIKLFSLFTKHHGFAEEGEWRLVYLPERDLDRKFQSMVDYHLGRFGLEPRLKLKVKQMPGVDQTKNFFEHLVRSLIVGPSISTPLSVQMLKRMVSKLGNAALENRIFASQIPFRNRQIID